MPKAHPVAASITIPLTERGIGDLIEIALYGGGHWVEKITYPDGIMSMSEGISNLWENRHQAWIQFKPYDEEAVPLTFRGVVNAIQAEPDTWLGVMSGEGDQIDADHLLQLALFGEPVFG